MDKPEALRKEAEELERVFDSISDLIFILDKDHTITRVNAAFAKALSANPKDLIGKKCYLVLHKSDKPWPECPLEKTKSDHKSHTEEVDDPNIGIPLLVTISPIFNEKKELVGAVHIAKDISELRKTRQDLEESTEMFRTIFQDAPDGIYLSDLTGNFIDGNRAAEQIIGYKKEELTGKSFLKLNLLSQDEAMKAAALLSLNLLGKSTGPDEIVLNRRDGSKVEIEVRTFPIKFKDKTLVLGIARDISARKKTEAELRDSEARLRGFLDAATERFFLFDSRFKIIMVNKIVLDGLGVDKSYFIGKHLLDISPDMEEKGIYAKYQEVLRTGKPLFIEDYQTDPRYGMKYFAIKAFRVGDGLGVIATDITERKKIDEAFKRSEEKVRRITDAVPIVVYQYEFSPDGKQRFTFVSSATENILGLKREEILNDFSRVWDLIIPEDEASVSESIQASYREFKPWQHDFRMKTAQGEVKWIRGQSTPEQRLEDGTVIWNGTLQDVTDIKKKEEAQAQLAAIVESSDDAIISESLDGFIISWNNGAEKIYGYTSGEIIGKPSSILYPANRMYILPGILEKIKQGGHFDSFETERVRKDGSKIDVSLTFSPLKDKDGNVIGVSSIARDITERKKILGRIKDSESAYRALYDSSKDAVMIVSPEKGFIAGNASTVEMFKCKGESEFITKSPAELSPEFQPDGISSLVKAQEMMKIATEKGSNFFEWKHKRLDGEEFFATVLLTKLELKGEPVLQATVRDITEQKMAELELKKRIEALERFQRITIDRELKMKELKAKIKELEAKTE